MKVNRITALFPLIIAGSLLAMEGIPLTFEIEEKKELSEPAQWKKLPPLVDVIAEETITPSGKVENNSAWLNLKETEVLTRSTFKENIEQAQSYDLPYTIAIVTTYDQEEKRVYTIYDAYNLNQYLFKDDYRHNRYQFIGFKDPTTQQPIVGNINYFTIYGIEEEFEYLGNDYNIFKGPDRSAFMQNFFESTHQEPQDENTKESFVSFIAFYREGIAGIKKDLIKAEKLYKTAIKKNYPTACTHLGLLYKDLGKYREAKELFEQDAQKDFPLAWAHLGNLYLDGLGVLQDYARAWSCFKKAQDLGEYVTCDLKNLASRIQKEQKASSSSSEEEEEPPLKKAHLE